MAATLFRTQQDIAAALLDNAAAPSATRWLAGDRERGLRRLALYRANVDAAAAKALSAAYPVMRQLVGEEFFDALAAAYRREHPSCSGDLHEFGESLADFVAAFDPTRSLAYLPDLARLEWAAHRAYGAADAEPLDPAALGAVAPQDQAALCLQFAPGTTVIGSTHPVARIWAVHQPGDDSDFQVDLRVAETALVTRSGPRVVVETLGAGDAAFIRRALAGATLATSLDAALTLDPDFDLGALLGRAIESGWLCGFSIQPEATPR